MRLGPRGLRAEGEVWGVGARVGVRVGNRRRHQRLLAKRQLCTAAPAAFDFVGSAYHGTYSKPTADVRNEWDLLGSIVVLCVVLCPESPCHGHRPAHMYPPLENVNETAREQRHQTTPHMRTHQDPLCSFTLYVTYT